MKNGSIAMESLQSLETFFTSICKDAVLSAHVQKHSQEIIDAMLHITKSKLSKSPVACRRNGSSRAFVVGRPPKNTIYASVISEK